MPATVQELIDQARFRHWAFRDIEMPDGAALRFLNQRQRTLLAEYGKHIEGLVGTSMTIAELDDDQLVGVEDGSGALYAAVTGYSVHEDGSGNLYIDDSEPPITVDPFGVDGGTPGFYLPDDFVRLINVVAVLNDNRQLPVTVVNERQRLEQQRGATMFLSGNRLVPARPLAEGNTGDVWDDVAAVQISYIAMQTFTAVTDALTLPAVLVEALISSLACLFARQSRLLKDTEKRDFVQAEGVSAAEIADAADEMATVSNRVIYRR